MEIVKKFRELPYVSPQELSTLKEKDEYAIAQLQAEKKLTFFEAYHVWKNNKKGLNKWR